MANLRGQIIDISSETRDDNIRDMQERADAEGLPITYPRWFDGTSMTRPLIERTRSPFPDSADSRYYPGRIYVGSLRRRGYHRAPSAAPDDRAFVWANVRKSNSSEGSISVQYFREDISGLAKKMVLIFIGTEEFMSIWFEPWTNLIMDRAMTRGKWEPWGSRVSLLVRIVLLFSGHFDGAVTPSDSQPKGSAKRFAPTLRAVGANISTYKAAITRRMAIGTDATTSRKRSLCRTDNETCDSTSKKLKAPDTSTIEAEYARPVDHSPNGQNPSLGTTTDNTETSLLEFYQQTRNQHHEVMRERNQLKADNSILTQQLRDLQTKQGAAEQHITTLTKSLERQRAGAEKLDFLTKEINKLKTERRTQDALLDELQRAFTKQEDIIKAQQEAAEREKRFRQQHDKEFKPMIITVFTDMFRSAGWTSGEASEKAQERYRAICGLGVGQV